MHPKRIQNFGRCDVASFATGCTAQAPADRCCPLSSAKVTSAVARCRGPAQPQQYSCVDAGVSSTT